MPGMGICNILIAARSGTRSWGQTHAICCQVDASISLYAACPSRHQHGDVAMLTSILLDGQIAWRHHGLMRIKSAEMGRIAPLQ